MSKPNEHPRVVGKLTTLLVLVPLMIIVGILIIRDKGLIDKISSFIKKEFASNGKATQINAVFSWEKEPSQYGLDPEIKKRADGGGDNSKRRQRFQLCVLLFPQRDKTEGRL